MSDRPARSIAQTRLGATPVAVDRDAADLGLSDFWGALRQRRAILLATILLIPLCAWLTLQQITPQYTATGSLIYEPSEYKVRELQSIVRSDPTTEAMMSSQAEILQSLHIAQRVAERGNLFDDPAFNAAKRNPGFVAALLTRLRSLRMVQTLVEPPVETTGPVWDHQRDRTLEAVKAALHAEPIRFSHVVTVTFTATDPNVAAAAVNNAMDVYIKDQYAAKHRMVDNATALLDRQASELRRQVRRLEESVSAYRSDHGLSQGVHAATDTEDLTQLTEDLAKARLDLASASSRVDAARGGAGAEAQAAVAPSVVQLRARVEQLAAAIQARSARLGSAHPEALAMAREYDDAGRALKAEISRVVAALEADQRAAQERVASLESMRRQIEVATAQNSRTEIPLNDTQRDLDAARAQLQAVLDRIQQTAQQTQVESSEAHEITEALPPDRPSAPHVAQTMAASVAAAIFLGLLLVYVLHLMDGTVRNGDDLRMLAGLNCMALVPEVGRKTLRGRTIDSHVVHRPQSVFAEQIRSLRAAMALDRDQPTIVAVTSAAPAEGKSVITLALARSAQLSGEQVLIVECDVRKPSLRDRMACAPKEGLLEVLRSEAVWKDVVREDTITGVEYITAGIPTGEAFGLFQSIQMRQLLEELRKHYTLILLDAPPVEAIAETRLAVKLAEATVFCVRWRHTPGQRVVHALELLRDAHVTVMGTILTRVDMRAHLRSGYADAAVYHRRYKAYYRE
jgi:polysaccharide biosynthesis transport protein